MKYYDTFLKMGIEPLRDPFRPILRGLNTNFYSFGIQSLFNAGEEGAWYDPSDINNYMSQLGPELVTNGNFSNGTTGWNATGSAILSVVSGALRVENGAVVTGGSNQIVSTVAGRWYQFTYYVNPATSGGAVIRARDAVSLTVLQTATQNTAGTYTFTFVATGSTTQIQSINSSNPIGVYHEIDNVSVKELTAVNNATLFQDSAGTTPVTAVEQPVGLMLDKSKGLVLGSELISPIDFTSGWSTSGAAVTFNSATSYTSAGVANVFRSFFTVGAWYKLEIRATFTGGFTLFNGVTGLNQIGSALVSGQTQTIYFNALAAQLNIRATSAGTITINSISVRELPGNHAFQATSANRPTLSARVNLLTNTHFLNAVAGTPGTAPTGWSFGSSGGQLFTPSSGVLGFSATAARQIIGFNLSLGVSEKQTWSVRVISNPNSLLFNQLFAVINAPSGSSVTYAANGVTVNSTTYMPSANDVLSADIVNGATAGSSTFRIGVGASGAATGYAEFSQPQAIVTGNGVGIPTYQRVNTSTDYDTTGFPLYLKFNGTNSSLATNSINFTSTDKMTVWGGCRNFATGAQIVAELSASSSANSGSFAFGAGSWVSGGNRLGGQLAGTTLLGYDSPANFAVPLTVVQTNAYNIGGTTALQEAGLRVNGAVQSPLIAGGSGSAGTGNFGNYPLYLGARAGTSLFFNGNLYSLIVRGAQSSANQIESAERYVNRKTNAY